MSIDLIKKLREETQASISDCKGAIEESGDNYEEALKVIKSRGLDKAAKKAQRSTGAGIIEAYIHGGGRVGVLLELQCETDFVGKNETFQALAHELAMQIAAMFPESEEELLAQDYIKDSSMTVKDLIENHIAKLGENIKVGKFTRYEV